uniref:Putative kazal type serine protease inhibitor n=2 Tax=Culex tarsalis TaxID=7177 RepID=A0A1Q3FQR2_CULTA
MSVPSPPPSPPPTSSSVGLNLDSGINYVKCATADNGPDVTNNPSAVPWPEPRTGSSSRTSSISISGPTGVDDPQQQAPAGSPQSGPRRPKSGGWMWQRWVNPLPSLASSLALVAVSPFQRRTNDGNGSSRSSVASSTNGFESGEKGGVAGRRHRRRRSRRSDREVTPCEREEDEENEESEKWPPASWWRRHRSGCGIDVKLVLAITVLIGVIDYSEAGTCWLRRMESTGKCNKLFARNVTRESCCHAGAGLGFSERDITDVQIFFVNAFNDGMDCGSCLDSCDRAKCGPNKRCVMKKGRPKCICAPNCKAPKQIKHHHPQQQQHFPDQKIKVINLSESQRNRGQYFTPSIQLAGGSRSSNSNNKRSIRLQDEDPAKSPARTVKTSLSEKPSSQRSSTSKQATTTSRRKDNLLESVTLVDSSSSSSQSLTPRPTDQTVLTTTTANVRHRNRKSSLNRTLAVADVHRGTHSRDFGRPRLLRLTPGNTTTSGTKPAGSRVPRQPQYREDMFYVGAVPQVRRSRLRGAEPDFGNEIVPHTGFYNPVCGTDGKTYKTECQLKKRACRQESTTLAVAYKGHCQTSCRFVQCPDGKHCIEDQNATPHCVTCIRDCPTVDPWVSPKSLICGTDGITYRSVCELKRKACLTGRAIPMAYRGRCIEAATCETIKCKDRQHCLTDLSTHKPRCVSCSYKCPRAKRQQQQPRQFGATGGHHRNQHQLQPPNVKLCGTNNHTYHSWCHMLRDSCNTGLYIDVQHSGVCSFERSHSTPAILSHAPAINIKP